MDKVKISVVVSTFNRKKLLKRAINSVLAQSLKDFELIVVDDCSKDGTDKLVSSFGDKRIRYFKTKKNSGADSLPKNIGIIKAKGEYIAFLDDDDAYRPDALKILTKYLERTGADVVYGDYILHDNGKNSAGWSLDFNPSMLGRRNYISMCVAAMKRDILLEIGGFDENIPKFKDWNLWVRLQKFGKSFVHIPIIVTDVYLQKESISNKYKTEIDEGGMHKPTFNPSDCPIWATKTVMGAEKDLKVAIFTLTMNRLDYTKMMFESVYKLAGHAFDWFVVDQGSTDGTIDFVKDNAFKVIENKENIGIARGWNKAVEEIKKAGAYDIIIKIDNDCQMMTDGWLRDLVDIFKRNRKVILSPYVEGLESSPGGVLRQTTTTDSPYMLINDHLVGLVPYLGGICWAAPAKFYDSFSFDDSGFMVGNKDYIASQYAKQLGYTMFYVEELRLWHIDGTEGQKTKYPKYIKDVEALRKEKGDIY